MMGQGENRGVEAKEETTASEDEGGRGGEGHKRGREQDGREKRGDRNE